MSETVALLGDIGADIRAFELALLSLGADLRSGSLPQGLHVIQLGDLVRVSTRSASSSLACLALAERFMAANPGRWTQLIGNHELAMLGGPRRKSWPAPDNTGEAALLPTLTRLWHQGNFHLAAAVPQSELLVTHAGLTNSSWHWLHTPDTPALAATQLNRFRGGAIADVAIGGSLTGEPFRPSADVTWAEVSEELYQPWLRGKRAPFSQVHGHASPWNWGTGDWWPDTPTDVREATCLDPATRRTTLTLADGHTLTSVDWGLSLGQAEGKTWPVFTLPGTVTTAAN